MSWSKLKAQVIMLIRKHKEREKVYDNEDKEITNILCAPEEKVSNFKQTMKTRMHEEIEKSKKQVKARPRC